MDEYTKQKLEAIMRSLKVLRDPLSSSTARVKAKEHIGWSNMNDVIDAGKILDQKERI